MACLRAWSWAANHCTSAALLAKAGSELGHRVVRPLWREFDEETMNRLDGLTLEELCARAHRAGIPGRLSQGGDFEI